MRSVFVAMILLTFGCTEKKQTIEVTRDNFQQVLTEYGKKHPENEVTIVSEMGTIKIRLYDDVPLHRANFVKQINDGTYDNAVFYRVVNQFMVQGGIHPKELGYTLPAEFNTKYIHKKGALSMAQSEENNPNRESSATEFFIVHGSVYKDYQVENDEQNFNLKLTPEQRSIYQTQGGYMSLDQQYTVFGEVTEGFDVIDKLATLKVYNTDKPMKDIPFTISLSQAR